MLILIWLLFSLDITKLNSSDFDTRQQHIERLQLSWKKYPVGIICMFKEDVELKYCAEKLLQGSIPAAIINDIYGHISAVLWLCSTTQWNEKLHTDIYWMDSSRVMCITRVYRGLKLPKHDQYVAGWEVSDIKYLDIGYIHGYIYTMRQQILIHHIRNFKIRGLNGY